MARGRLSGHDRATLVAFVVVPLALQVALIWLPAIASVALSFTSWNGIGSPAGAAVVGLDNYVDLLTVYPPFWPALLHNLAWLGALDTERVVAFEERANDQEVGHQRRPSGS